MRPEIDPLFFTRSHLRQKPFGRREPTISRSVKSLLLSVLSITAGVLQKCSTWVGSMQYIEFLATIQQDHVENFLDGKIRILAY